MSAAAVCAWQSGFPLRVSFASGKPDYDSERYAMTRMLAAKESDLLVWIASFYSRHGPARHGHSDDRAGHARD